MVMKFSISNMPILSKLIHKLNALLVKNSNSFSGQIWSAKPKLLVKSQKTA